MKQTAVDLLIIQMSLEDVCKYSNQLADAKEMEKEQMIGFAKNLEHIDINKSDMENELNCYLNLEDTEELLDENFKSE